MVHDESMSFDTCVVTGANGFIGQHLCALLESSQIKYRACARRPDGDRYYAYGNLFEFQNWADLFKDAHTVVHLAAMVHEMNKSADLASEYMKFNCEMTARLAKEAKKFGVRKFIFVSSIKVNGESTSSRPFNADDQPNPQDPYAQSKLAAEQELLKLHDDQSFEVVIVRSPLIYGPGVKGNIKTLISLIKLRIPLPFGATSNRRSLISVYNLCDLLKTCLLKGTVQKRVMLASDNDDVSLTRLIRGLARGLRIKLFLIPVPQSLLTGLLNLIGQKAYSQRLLENLHVDISATMHTLTWRPPYSFDDSINLMFHQNRLESKIQ